jgi:hypothetical protein
MTGEEFLAAVKCILTIRHSSVLYDLALTLEWLPFACPLGHGRIHTAPPG